MYKSDSHVHSNFSGDSNEDINNVINRALELNMDEITITDHLDLDFPDEPNIFLLDIKEYIKKLKELKKKYEGKLKIKIGIELGLQPHLKDVYDDIFECEDIDFIIGSSHTVNHKDVSNKKYFEGLTKDEAHRVYFEDVLKNIDIFPKISVYGHLDFINRYGREVYEDYKILDLEKHKDLIDKILRKLVEKNIGIEINTSGVRYGLSNFHPCKEILKKYRELGGKIITIGSDSHKTINIMQDFDRAKQELKKLGFEKFSTFDKRTVEYRDL